MNGPKEERKSYIALTRFTHTGHVGGGRWESDWRDKTSSPSEVRIGLLQRGRNKMQCGPVRLHIELCLAIEAQNWNVSNISNTTGGSAVDSKISSAKGDKTLRPAAGDRYDHLLFRSLQPNYHVVP